VLLLAGLSTGHRIGLAIVAVVFIGFALSVSFLAPRRWPDFPGKNGMSVFVIASLVLFVGMLSAVIVFGREPKEAGAEVAPEGSPAHLTIGIKETEYRIQLPALKELKEGTYTFKVHNAGQVAHDLVIEGGHAAGPTHTALIAPGGDATLKVALSVGNYTLYCSVDGHRKLGMQAQISVG
jgi:plastocyanin